MHIIYYCTWFNDKKNEGLNCSRNWLYSVFSNEKQKFIKNVLKFYIHLIKNLIYLNMKMKKWKKF